MQKTGIRSGVRGAYSNQHEDSTDDIAVHPAEMHHGISQTLNCVFFADLTLDCKIKETGASLVLSACPLLQPPPPESLLSVIRSVSSTLQLLM